MTKKIPKATHIGTLTIGNKEIFCAVLEDGTRVISRMSMQKALGKSVPSGKHSPSVEHLPPFLRSLSLKPFITNKLIGESCPIVFKSVTGQISKGYKATLLPEVCEVYLKARDAGKLPHNQQHVAAQCDILIRALAVTGIVALVDEASGYQEDREREALQKILSKYISEELLPWTKRFPDVFFKSYKRMYSWPEDKMCPSHIGNFIKRYVYKELAPGVLQELERLNPKTELGYRKNTHHQHLNEDCGIKALDRQLIKVTTLMKIAKNREEFQKYYEKTSEIEEE